MHVLSIIAVGWIMIIGAFVFTTIGNFLGINAETIAVISFYFFIYFIFILKLSDPFLLSPKEIKGKIIEYSKVNNERKFLTDVYIETEDKKIIKFKKLMFEDEVWEHISKIYDMRVFFIDYIKIINGNSVWGFKVYDDKYYISKQMKNNVTKIRTILITVICSILIFTSFIISHFGPGNKFHFSIFLFLSLFPATFLVQWYASISYKKDIFENRMKLLDEAGIPRPLIWS